jgi:GNAT superfamily N-acetyltransferase
MEHLKISTDKAELDVAFIHQFLTQQYWALGRTREDVQTTIDHCVCFGLFLGGNQIGFARVLTDFAVFAYLMDVFVVETERGKGYASTLLEYVFHFPAFTPVAHWKLTTSDAHGLYAKFGFVPLAHPDKLMERLTP